MFVVLEKYRKQAQILLGAIGLSFIGFGVSVATPDEDYLVKVGNQAVTLSDVSNLSQNQQGQVNHQAVLEQLISRAYLLEGAHRMGIGVSLEELKKAIVLDPTFHDETGKFSQAKFNEYLAARRITEDAFVEEVRREFELQNLLNLSQAGVLVSDAQVQQLNAVLRAERTLRVATFDPRRYADGIKVDDGLLKAFYEKNKQQFILPKAVKFEYITLSLDDVAAQQTVTEEELKKAFETRQAGQKADVREVAHIMFNLPKGDDAKKVRAEAEKVLAQLKANPERFAELAKQYSQDTASANDGGSLGVLAKQSGLPQSFEDAAFQLKQGEISELVETPSALHIIRVLSIPSQKTFAEEKEALTAELKKQKAQRAFAKIRVTLADEAFASPDSLAKVATKMKLTLKKHDEWVSKDNQQLPLVLVNALFSDEVLKRKQNSDPIAVDNNQVWVVRATEVREQTQQTFDTVKNQVKESYIAEQALKVAKQEAEKALKSLQAGQNVALNWHAQEVMDIESARRNLPPKAFDALLKAKPTQGKPAFAYLEGMPVPMLVEVISIQVPENNQGQEDSLRQVLSQRNSNYALERLSAYLHQHIKQKAGLQRLDAVE